MCPEGAGDGRKFQINPGPLKVVPAAHRRAWERLARRDPAALQCEAQLRDGSGRCLSNGREFVGDHWLCGTHARVAKKGADHA